jgi:hypothetical protein
MARCDRCGAVATYHLEANTRTLWERLRRKPPQVWNSCTQHRLDPYRQMIRRRSRSSS